MTRPHGFVVRVPGAALILDVALTLQSVERFDHGLVQLH
jgi:hypothetical protein